MNYLLDTNAWIAFLRDKSPSLRARLLSRVEGDIGLCSVAVAELVYGAHRSARRNENLSAIRGLQADFQSLPFDDRAAAVYGQIRADLDSLGTPIGHNDLLIASIALANDLILVTNNTREFQRIAGLRTEDWQKA